MGPTKVNNKKKSGEVQEAPLKGTWISVSVVGVVILLTYFLLFGLYMARV
ncbi:cytochrome c oxidase subunit 2A [Bacillaceae bacterium C204]